VEEGVELAENPGKQTPPAEYPPKTARSALKYWLAAGLIAAAIYGYNAGWFDEYILSYPATCAEVSARLMNYIYKDSLLGRMGLKILEVETSTNDGSRDKDLSCNVKAVTTHGEMKFHLSTETINGKTYVEIAPRIFD
jgi:hypothetical protein